MRLLPLFVATVLLTAPALAARTIKAVTLPAPPKIGLRADLLSDLDDVQKKVMQLATAIPASKYSWARAANTSRSPHGTTALIMSSVQPFDASSSEGAAPMRTKMSA